MTQLSAETLQEIQKLAGELANKFSPPELIPGCEVKDVSDKDFYALDNGWVEALVAQHNQQRCRWKGKFSGIQVGDYVDVIYFKNLHLFEVLNRGGVGAIPGPGGNVEPKAGKCNIDDTEYDTFDALIAALGSGILGVVGEGSFTTDFTGGNATLPAGALLRGRGINISNLTSADSYTLFTAGTFTIEDLTIANTVASGQYCFGSDFGNVGRMTLVRLENKQGNTAFFAGNTRLNNCEFLAGSGYAVYGYSTTGQILIEVFGGIFEGNIHADQDTVITLYNLPLINGTLTTANGGSIVGWYRDANGNIRSAGGDISIAIKVKNTSGATRANGDIGYVNQAGEFKVTTTATDANMVGSGCVVVSGGANNADIIVVKQGRVPINYTGTAPSAGDYLVSSASAGLAQQQTTMRPEIFAVCVGAGAAGIVEALLLINTIVKPIVSSYSLYYVASHTGSDFNGTINGAPSGTSVVYSVVSGNEDSIKPFATTNLAKLRLYNSTRGTYALISDVNTGTNTITVTSSADISGWQNGDAITTRSPTVTATLASAYYYEYEIISAEIPALTRTIGFNCQISDSTAGMRTFFHPLETYDANKLFLLRSQAASIDFFGLARIPLINKKFTALSQAGGSATKTDVWRISFIEVAAP